MLEGEISVRVFVKAIWVDMVALLLGVWESMVVLGKRVVAPSLPSLISFRHYKLHPPPSTIKSREKCKKEKWWCVVVVTISSCL